MLKRAMRSDFVELLAGNPGFIRRIMTALHEILLKSWPPVSESRLTHDKFTRSGAAVNGTVRHRRNPPPAPRASDLIAVKAKASAAFRFREPPPAPPSVILTWTC